MRDTNLISAWEAALREPPVWRAVTLLHGAGFEAAAELTIDQREAALLELHQRFAGDRLDAEASCGGCGERLEVVLSASELLAATRSEEAKVSLDEWTVSLRQPTTLDIAWALDQADAEAALFSRCVAAADEHGASRSASELPEGLRQACEAQLDRLAPLADLDLQIACPVCGATSALPFDATPYVLAALRGWVERRLDDAARLCRHFGWSEAEVLAMSPWRRQFYLGYAEER